MNYKLRNKHDLRGGDNGLIDWDAVRKEFEESDITAKALADKHGIPSSTLHGRKKREKWKRKKRLRKATDSPGGQKQNGNAEGNSGGSAPANNTNALTHGLYAKYLPEDTRLLMQEMNTINPADLLWENIMIQYAAIVRAQKIMFVRDEMDNASNVTGIEFNPMFADKKGEPAQVKESREWHMAYKKQETFMNAQSRAMATLSNLIRQFVALADEADERKLRLGVMGAQIDKLKVEAQLAEYKAEDLSDQSTPIEIHINDDFGEDEWGDDDEENTP